MDKILLTILLPSTERPDSDQQMPVSEDFFPVKIQSYIFGYLMNNMKTAPLSFFRLCFAFDLCLFNRYKLVLSFILITGFLGLSAQPVPDPVFPQIDNYGSVNKLLRRGDTLFIGGSFSHLYFNDSCDHYATMLDSMGASIKGLPKFNGSVSFVFPDSSKGFYFSGSFTMVGDSMRNGLVHIDSNLQVTAQLREFDCISSTPPPEPFLYRNNTLYLRGLIGAVGKGIIHSSGGMFSLSTSTMFNHSPEVNGPIRSVISDGQGGWFIGGEFTAIGNTTRTGLARIDSMGNVSSWNPVVNGIITKLYLAGDKLIVSGLFDRINGTSAVNLCALDTTTGSPLAWNIGLPTGKTAAAMFATATTLYIGGNFDTVGTTARKYAAAIDLTTGLVTSWNPAPDNSVMSIAISGTKVFLAGSFSMVGSTYRSNLACVDISTGLCNSWNPSPNSTVNSIAIEGNNLYLGGMFTYLSGSPCKYLAKIDMTTGSFIPSFSAPYFADYGYIQNLDIISGSLYIAGWFNRLNGVSLRGWIAALNKTTGSLLNFKVAQPISMIDYPGQGVDYSFAVSSTNPDKIYIGGKAYIGDVGFKLGGVSRDYVAAIDVTTSDPTAWNPMMGGPVYAAALHQNTLYLGGKFGNVGTSSCSNLAAIDVNTGAKYAFFSAGGSLTYYSNTSAVLDLKIVNSTLYIGGSFTDILSSDQITSYPRKMLAAINISNNTLTALSKNFDTYDYAAVNTILPVGNFLYVGGSFSGIDGLTRTNLAKISLTGTNDVLGWNPTWNVSVSKLFYQNGKIIGIPLFMTDTASGTFLPWDPMPDKTNYLSLAITNDRTIAAGDFNIIGQDIHVGIAAYNLRTRTILNCTPNIEKYQSVSSIDLLGNKLYIGGQFATAGGLPRNNVAEIDLTTGTPTSWNPAGVNVVTKIKAIPGKIFVLQSSTLSAFNTDGSANTWNANPDDLIRDFETGDAGLYIVGLFKHVNGVSKNYFAKVDTTTGALMSWGTAGIGSFPSPDYLRVIRYNNELIIGGRFNAIYASPRKNLGALDLASATLTSFNPMINVGLPVIANDKLFICASNPLTVGGIPLSSTIGSLDPESGALYPWNPRPNHPISDVVGFGSNLIVGGIFDTISGERHFGLAMLPDAQLKLTAISDSAFCKANKLDVFYSMSDSILQFDTLKVEISDSSGDFTAATAIGRLWGPSLPPQGVIHCIIPGIVSGYHYKVRIVSTRPYLVSDTSTDMIIHPSPRAGFVIDQFIQCLSGNNFTYTDTTSGAIAARLWRLGDGQEVSGNVLVNHTYDSAQVYAVKLIVTYPYGCMDSSSQQIVLRPMPVASFSLSDSVFCNRQTVSLIDSSSVIKPSLTYWSLDHSVFNTNTTTAKQFTREGVHTLTLTSVSVHGCKDSVSKTIQVLPSPNVGFTMSDSFECLVNNLFQLTDTSTVSSGTLLREWNFDSNTDTLQHLAIHLNAPGVFPVKLTLTTDQGCSDSAKQNVYVFANPAAHIYATGTTTICDGNKVALDADTASEWSYQWYKDEQPIDSADRSSYSGDLTGGYRILVIDSNGCADTSSIISILVNPLPSAMIYATGDTTICQNEQSLFTTDSTAAGYQWLRDGVAVVGATFTSYNSGMAGSYSIHIVDSNGCSDTSDAISLTVHPLPLVSVGVQGSTVFCSGEERILATDTSGSWSYQWYRDGLLIPGALSYSYTADTTARYGVKTTDTTGCSDTASLGLQMKPLPVASFTTSGTDICEGDSIRMNAVITGYDSYQWLQNDTAIFTDTADIYYAMQTAFYKLKVTENGCDSVSLPTMITVHAYPDTPVITHVGDTLFSSASENNTWFLNDTMISGADSQFFVIQQSGIYSVMTSNVYGCSNISLPVTLIKTGITSVSATAILLVYPNPADKLVAIVSDKSLKNIAVFNDLGVQIKSIIDISGNRVTLNTEDLPAAGYHIEITCIDNSRYQYHLIIMH